MEQFRPFVEKLPDFFKPWGEEILLRYFDFEGRTSRETFWHVFLNDIIIGLVIGALGFIPILGAVLGGLYSLATIIPNIAIIVRRLNDQGKSWPFIFLGLIPCVGWIIILVFMLQPSSGGGYGDYTSM
ncbi:MAG: DUF805 domain-containing protein [Lachnospiraceae bacterium]|nr:DUF805 domain-containing protein [Lachnospiraceae bacterium]